MERAGEIAKEAGKYRKIPNLKLQVCK